MKKWVILSQKSETDIIRILLKNRGITKKKDMEEFLHPKLENLKIENLDIKKSKLNKAVERIKKAIDDKESVVVYTDYDVDGICGGSIVWETLYELGGNVMPYIPHRVEEGYGLSKKGIDRVKKEYNPKLIITVDHGITAIDKINYARELGIDTIVLDHHVLPKKLPDAIAVVHTTKLAAAGLSWFFCNYLISVQNHPRGVHSATPGVNFGFQKLETDQLNNLDLVALATIADLVPLVGPNRTIVKFGLEALNRTKRLGLKSLIKEAGLSGKKIGVYEVGHILAPRINALGRLTHALDAMRLICTKDKERAINLASLLNSINQERQSLTIESTTEAIEIVKNGAGQNKILFVASKSYQEGILGLVASKLVEQFYKPAIAIAVRDDFSKASARSVTGFNIVETIRKVSDLLEDVGGHPMAAGFTIATKNLIEFKNRLIELVDKELDGQELIKKIKIDIEIPLDVVSTDLYNKIQTLSPFGVGNPEPVFASLGVRVLYASLVGKEKKHLKLKVNDNNGVYDCIGFEMSEIYPNLNSSSCLDIAYTIDKDDWNGSSQLQLKLKDVKFSTQ